MGVLEYLPTPGELEQEDNARFEAEAPPEPPEAYRREWEDGYGWEDSQP